MDPSPYRAPFTSAHDKARIVKVLLIVGAIAAGVSLLAESLTFAFPPLTEDQELGDNPIGALLMLVTFGIAVLELIIYVTTVVAFLLWLYRAYDNLRAFDRSRPLDYSPGFVAGSFFIPFVNLVIPYRAVKETWEKSLPPDEAILSAPGAPAYFPVWWFFWLSASISGNISVRLSFNEDIPESTVTAVSIFASALFIVAAFFAYQVVDAIDKRQEETSRKLNLGKFSGPPPPLANLPNEGSPVFANSGVREP